MTSIPLRALPVDLDELVIAFEAEGELQWYLDVQTGAVILVGREYEPAEHGGLTATEIETDPTRFVKVPPAEPHLVVEDMRAFAEVHDDAQLRESLELALSAPRPEKRFKSALSWLPEHQARWHAWRQDKCLARVKNWLARLGLVAESRAA
ncbi:MAG: UPF0158 family protein [Myxococcota bacterium]